MRGEQVAGYHRSRKHRIGPHYGTRHLRAALHHSGCSNALRYATHCLRQSAVRGQCCQQRWLRLGLDNLRPIGWNWPLLAPCGKETDRRSGAEAGV